MLFLGQLTGVVQSIDGGLDEGFLSREDFAESGVEEDRNDETIEPVESVQVSRAIADDNVWGDAQCKTRQVWGYSEEKGDHGPPVNSGEVAVATKGVV